MIIAAAFLAGSALRFWNLARVPVALYCDEAFQGYEAYCLLQTGADSRGIPFPLFFDIFGVGWQEPLYVYLTMAPVALLGNTESAVRVVAAAAGSLAILAVAWLSFLIGGRRAAAAAAVTMAVSPWAFHFSRVGFQATLLPLFLAAGAAALLRGVSGSSGSFRPGGGPRAGPGDLRPGWLAAGLFILAASLYTYVAARGVIPLLLAGFAVVFFHRLRNLHPRHYMMLGAAFVLPALPLLLFSFSPAGLERLQDVGIASQLGGAQAAGRFLGNYISYFSPSFLLTDGDPNLRHSVGGFGMLHAHDLLFLAAGILAASLRRRPADLFMGWWLVVAPVGAALTADPAHAVRAIGMIPAIHALAGNGAATLFRAGSPLDPRRLRGSVVLVAVLLAGAISAGLYLHHYFSVYPTYSGPVWQYGLKQAYQKIEARAGAHDSVYVTRAEDFPWIHRLYLLRFPPRRYQQERFAGTPYLFDEPVFYGGGLVAGRRNPLFLLKPRELPASGLEARDVIRNPDGTPAFVLAW
jgi:4-amino-4-deoxy-L-arabinose transferase-like glycosyltransferase